ncbi:hypothetical protein HMPREF1861_01942 [Corynebacterium kroppenstedtii]|nr:hypothetical protein HMPREF1861_01942 [Corynebacterium kroppenstedtii]
MPDSATTAYRRKRWLVGADSITTEATHSYLTAARGRKISPEAIGM